MAESKIPNTVEQVVISWTPEMLRRFKRAHKRALKRGGKNSVFAFRGNKFIVAYASYLIEYLEWRIENQATSKT